MAKVPLRNLERAALCTLWMMKRRYRSEEWLRTGVKVGEKGMPFAVDHRRACARRELRLKHLEMVGEAVFRCGGPARVGAPLTFEVYSGTVVTGMVGMCAPAGSTRSRLAGRCVRRRPNFIV